MNDALRVEKIPLQVELLLTNGERLGGTLFLSPFAPAHSGPQTVADLWAEPEPFVPFGAEGGRFLLVGKGAVAAVRHEPPPAELDELLVRVPVSLVLAGGHQLAGDLLGEAGVGTRSSDLLNGAWPWLRLEVEGRRCWAVKGHIVTAEAEVPPPLP